jgi:hypothetical protein
MFDFADQLLDSKKSYDMRGKICIRITLKHFI